MQFVHFVVLKGITKGYGEFGDPMVIWCRRSGYAVARRGGRVQFNVEVLDVIEGGVRWAG